MGREVGSAKDAFKILQESGGWLSSALVFRHPVIAGVVVYKPAKKVKFSVPVWQSEMDINNAQRLIKVILQQAFQNWNR